LAGDAACAGCHERPGDVLHRDDAPCDRCHGVEAWKPADFDHRELFRFDRDHGPDCEQCHPDRLDAYDCYTCHAHSERGVAHEHIEEGIRDYEDCVACHRSADEDEAERAWRRQRSQRRDGRDRRGGRDHDDEHEHEDEDDD